MKDSSKIAVKDVTYFELADKDNSQISTKQNSNGFPSLYGLPPVCIAMYKKWDDENKKWDKETLMPQTLRYVAGEAEILKSKQRADIVGAEAERIYFRNGGLSVTSFEPALLEFIKNHSRNADNPNRDKRREPLFKEVDKNKAKIDAVNENRVWIEVQAIIIDLFKTDPESIIAVAAAIGVNTDQDAVLIEHDMMVRARKNPKQMMADIGNPMIRQFAQVKIAEKRGVIKVGTNVVTWGDGSATGFSCAEHLNTRDEFCEWAVNTPEGKKVYDKIKFRLQNPITQL